MRYQPRAFALPLPLAFSRVVLKVWSGKDSSAGVFMLASVSWGPSFGDGLEWMWPSSWTCMLLCDVGAGGPSPSPGADSVIAVVVARERAQPFAALRVVV